MAFSNVIPVNLAAAFIALLIGSYSDIKTREVPDWLSYGLIFFSIGTSLIYTLINWDYSYILSSVLGFALCFALAYGMFLLGQWGGGDTKLLMGIGAAIGLNFKDLLMVTFLFNVLIVGAVYGIFWSFVQVLRNKTKFFSKLKEYTIRKEILMYRRIFLVFAVVGIISVFFVPTQFKIPLFLLVAVVFIMFYTWMFVKIVEESCMIKEIPVEKLTEGDWIVKDIIIDKKKICGPKDLGISKEQINTLLKYKKKRKISKILIKEGVPFIPSFFLSLILLLIKGNWFVNFILLIAK